MHLAWAAPSLPQPSDPLRGEAEGQFLFITLFVLLFSHDSRESEDSDPRCQEKFFVVFGCTVRLPGIQVPLARERNMGHS